MKLEDYNKRLVKIKKNDETLGNVLKKMLTAYGMQHKYNETRIKFLWKETMGPTIDKYTQKIYINKRKVYIHIGAASLRQEVSFAKEKIKKMFNDDLGEEFVQDVFIL